jgi:hypothetical protein
MVFISSLLVRGNRGLILDMVHEYDFNRNFVPSKISGTPELAELFVSGMAAPHANQSDAVTPNLRYSSEANCRLDMSLDDLLTPQWMDRTVYFSNATVHEPEMQALLKVAFAQHQSFPNITQQLWTVALKHAGVVKVYPNCSEADRKDDDERCVTIAQQSHVWTSNNKDEATDVPIVIRIPASFAMLEDPQTALCNVTNTFFLPNYMWPGEYSLKVVQPIEHNHLAIGITVLKEQIRVTEFPFDWKRGGGCNQEEREQSMITWETVGNISDVSFFLTTLSPTAENGHGVACPANTTQRSNNSPSNI